MVQSISVKPSYMQPNYKAENGKPDKSTDSSFQNIMKSKSKELDKPAKKSASSSSDGAEDAGTAEKDKKAGDTAGSDRPDTGLPTACLSVDATDAVQTASFGQDASADTLTVKGIALQQSLSQTAGTTDAKAQELDSQAVSPNRQNSQTGLQASKSDIQNLQTMIPTDANNQNQSSEASEQQIISATADAQSGTNKGAKADSIPQGLEKTQDSGGQPAEQAGNSVLRNQNGAAIEPKMGSDPDKASMAKQDSDSSQNGLSQTSKKDQAQKVQKNETSSTDGIHRYSDLYSGSNVVIKISDSQAETKSTPIHQLANAVQEKLQQGKQEFSVDLYPQTLGKVSVKLVAENGILTVEIAASDPKTQSLLVSGAGDIQSILQSSTGRQVQVTQPDPSAQWYGQPQDGGENSSGNQQRQEDNENRNKHSVWAVEQTTDSMNAADFITLMRQANAS